MSQRVTIQDIADALSLSRNTVSKAINGTGVLADATRDKILQTAIEMGYRPFTYYNMPNTNGANAPMQAGQAGVIALLTGAPLGSSHFSATVLDKLQREITQLGYSLTMHHVTQEDRQTLQLPSSFQETKTQGIICFEMFDYAYSNMICALDVPTLFFDTPVLDGRALHSDRLVMDNRNAIERFVYDMVARKKTKIGFIGAYRHCQSFFERYMAFRDSMYLNGLPIEETHCITGTSDGVSTANYQEYLTQCFQSMQTLPEVFICANDFVAIDVLQVFKKLNISVPNDVWLCGFDDSPESKVITPSLTTIHIHGEILSFSAMQMLMTRIKEPNLNYRTMYTETTLIYRESTGD